MATINMTQSGTLPVGLEIDGELHRDFVLRPRTVADSVETSEDPRCDANGTYHGVVLYARQLESLGTLPKEKITADLLLGMYDVDMAEIIAQAGVLDKRLKTFRSSGEGPAEAAPGSAESGSTVASGA